MSSINWKEVAPKRADWERLTAECEKKGMPQPRWLNGIPTGLSDKDLSRLAEIATSFQTDRKRVPEDSPLTEGLSSFLPESKGKEPAPKKTTKKVPAKKRSKHEQG